MKLIVVLVCLLFFVCSCRAYDTGHHADLVRNVLPFFGFNNNSADVAVITNWMVDYFSYTLFSPIEELNSLHFDNINSMRNVSNYYNTLAINLRSAIQDCVRSNDVLRFLGLVGLSTHAVQDFYTHSGWVDFHQSACGCYRDDTWFSALYAVNGSVLELQPYLQALSTYSSQGGVACQPYEPNCFPGRIFHGDYCGGINKDSYTRPKFEASYSFAFAATWEWVFNVLIWADEAAGISYNSTDFATTTTLPGTSAFVRSAMSYAPNGDNLDDLVADVRSSVIVSYALRQPTAKTGDLQDGHWKGPGTGSISRLVASTLSFERRDSVYHSLYSSRRIYAPITTPNLYFDVIGDDRFPEVYNFFIPYSIINPAIHNFTKVKVRTTSVNVDNKLNTPSPYAIVTILGQRFFEAVQDDQYDFRPHWTSIKFIYANTTTVNIAYELWDDNFPNSDDQYTLTNNGNALNFMMDVYSHQLTFMNGGISTGIYEQLNNTVNVSYGDTKVSFYVTQQQQGNCTLNYESQWGNMFCPDEAYTEYLLHPICGDETTNSGGANSGFMFLVLSIFY